ncbi:hypothetical protein J3Q64DRAFT_1852868 [Phycomyces blakesleeanus]|uniref:Uncharacterized protein n=1 Tax=Phycomyces blakesleeanus TaxID=4837 RepID=A0ABR3ALU1_PHYBL
MNGEQLIQGFMTTPNASIRKRTVTIVPMKFFDKLRSIMGQFLRQKMFLMAGLIPLCFPRAQESGSCVTPWLQHALDPAQTHGDIRLPLLFQRLLHHHLRSSLNALHSVLYAINSIPRNSFVTATYHTCLSLSISVIVVFSDPSGRTITGWRRLLVSGAFIYDEKLGDVRPRLPTERTPSPYLVFKLFSTLSAYNHTFWSFPTQPTPRNIWHRDILNTLSFQVTLHHHAPTLFATTDRPICYTGVDTLRHFLYQCPQKLIA